MEKPADTQHELLDVIHRRWSPRSFDSRPVEYEKILTMLEALRWSESCFNEQPWRVIVASKEDKKAFDQALDCLVQKNQQWAKFAPLLILTLVKKTFSHNGKPNRTHLYDLGLGVQSLTLQAMDMGLFCHQMAGVDLEKVRREYQIGDDFQPVTAIAVGYPSPGDNSHLPDWVQESETAPRQRLDLEEIIWDGKISKSI